MNVVKGADVCGGVTLPPGTLMKIGIDLIHIRGLTPLIGFVRRSELWGLIDLLLGRLNLQGVIAGDGFGKDLRSYAHSALARSNHAIEDPSRFEVNHQVI